MSEFECINGHLVSPSNRKCPICGERAVFMDGLSSREIEARERAADKINEEEKDDEEE